VPASVNSGSAGAMQWEYNLVEKPFCEQLHAMGWEWLEGDTDVPDFTERQSFREVLLKERLTAALGSSTCVTVGHGSTTHVSPEPSATWSRQPGIG
jgi:hypothetical protein